MIRDFKEEDRSAILEVHSKNCDFPLPNYNSPVMIVKKTIEYAGIIVGSAFVRLTSETGLILNKDLPPIARAKIIKDLLEVLLREVKESDLEDTHVFVIPETDTHYADFLIKNLGFKKDTSLVLYKGIKEHEQSPTTAILEQC